MIDPFRYAKHAHRPEAGAGRGPEFAIARAANQCTQAKLPRRMTCPAEFAGRAPAAATAWQKTDGFPSPAGWPALCVELGMTDALIHPQQFTAGKHNMASAAFAELRAARREGRAPEGAELSFNDLIDTLNPLQHIPVVSEIYRGLTGDRISAHARVAGGALYGGPIGLVASVASLAIAGGSGEQGIGDRIYAAVFDADTPATETAIAAAPAEDTLALARANASVEQTASIVPEMPGREFAATSPVTGGAGLPQLSPEAFAALIGSFDNLEMAAAEPAEMEPGFVVAAPRMSLDFEGASDADENSASAPADLLGAMNLALDKYDALKHAR